MASRSRLVYTSATFVSKFLRSHHNWHFMNWEERWHPLREEWIIVAAHRQNRPWIGETVEHQETSLPDYVADWRIKLFTSLPLEALDRIQLATKLEEIGKTDR
jgi:hypothetical protein